MNYYNILVRSNHYHGQHGLSYQSVNQLVIGQIVQVELKNELVSGLVHHQEPHPPIKIANKIKPIQQIYDLPPLPTPQIQLIDWLCQYYPSPISTIASLFLPNNILKNLQEEIASKKQITNNILINNSHLPELTAEQINALSQINHPDTYLIHGRTGSGKTRIYLELAIQTIQNQQSVLVLTPEIGLTKQLYTSFKETFSNIVLTHSSLTPKQRQSEYLTSLINNQPQIVIGPRSSLFSPIQNLGLIIIDEFHDSAYKQDSRPYYLTSRVAAKLREITKAKLILASATPTINDYYLAKKLHKPIIRLDSLAIKTTYQKQISTVNLKNKAEFVRSKYLSMTLIKAIDKSLTQSHQVLLFLNRRGNARLIICDNCDWQAKCPNCGLHLTYHADKQKLICHQCAYKCPIITVCPECHNQSINYLSFGTKSIVDDVRKLFPLAKIARFDADNKKNESIEANLSKIKANQFDILIGTQLLTKGLDLTNLDLVGIINADSALQIADFTANERTYQLINQVIGRIGRGHLASQAIVQTFQPDNPVIKAAINDDWLTFYNLEIKDRQTYYLPPFSHLMKITSLKAKESLAINSLEKLKNQIQTQFPHIKFSGPSACSPSRKNSKYAYQLILRSSNRHDLTQIINSLPTSFGYDIDLLSIL